jgi:hypothetical protein
MVCGGDLATVNWGPAVADGSNAMVCLRRSSTEESSSCPAPPKNGWVWLTVLGLLVLRELQKDASIRLSARCRLTHVLRPLRDSC